MEDHLNWREVLALRDAIRFVEEAGGFSRGVGPKTLNRLVDRGFLEHAVDEQYGTKGYRTTAAGSAALNRRLTP